MWIRKELKEKAKAAFKANYWSCVLAALILTIVVGGAASVAGVTSKSSNTNTDTSKPQTSSEELNLDGDTLNINGVDIDLKTVDGSGIEEALNAFSEGLDNGVLTINGQDVDISNEEEVENLKNAIEELNDIDLSQYSHDDIAAGVLGAVAVIGGIILMASIVGALIRIFLYNPLVVGCEGFFMVNSKEKAKLSEIKRGFSPNWLHNVGAMLLKDIFLCLWSLLFIIPGIIKAYSYCMVPFILADNPNIGAKEAITLSRKMMDGNKWRAFVLDLSFIGWFLLVGLTGGILGIFYVNPYVYSTHAELYHALKNNA